MQGRVATSEEEICKYCLSILFPNGDCPYCGRHFTPWYIEAFTGINEDDDGENA